MIVVVENIIYNDSKSIFSFSVNTKDKFYALRVQSFALFSILKFVIGHSSKASKAHPRHRHVLSSARYTAVKCSRAGKSPRTKSGMALRAPAVADLRSIRVVVLLLVIVLACPISASDGSSPQRAAPSKKLGIRRELSTVGKLDEVSLPKDGCALSAAYFLNQP